MFEIMFLINHILNLNLNIKLAEIREYLGIGGIGRSFKDEIAGDGKTACLLIHDSLMFVAGVVFELLYLHDFSPYMIFLSCERILGIYWFHLRYEF